LVIHVESFGLPAPELTYVVVYFSIHCTFYINVDVCYTLGM
jgi:hypothetical protein